MISGPAYEPLFDASATVTLKGGDPVGYRYRWFYMML